MASGANTVAIKITGDVKEALAALDALGIKFEEEGRKVETAFGDKIAGSVDKTGNLFAKLGNAIGMAGLPFAESFKKMGERIDEADVRGQKFQQTLAELGKVSLLAGATGIGALAGETLKLGGNFQASMTQLVTGAGESEKAIGAVSKGILSLSPATATSTQQLSSGMYMIESAGFHGKAGLDVLRAAAEGAKTGNADLGTVADAVTTVLNSYGLKAKDAANVTSKLVETVASGKTHMQDLAAAMATVLPAAASAHVGLNQVLGAMATMTAAGTPAADAATYLKQTILQLENPTAKAANEMQSLGLNAVDISKNLGKRGLTGTFELMTEAIEKHMGPAGTVLIDKLQKAAAGSSTTQKAVTQLNQAMQDLGPGMSKIAQGYERGTVSAAEYKKAVASLDPEHQKLMKTVASLTSTVDNSASTSVSALDRIIHGLPPAQQTYVAALANMVGGTKSMQAALELTGQHAATFTGNVANISKTTADANGHVKGFSTTQKDMNFKLAAAKDAALAMGTEIGLKLIPIVTKLMTNIQKATAFLLSHKEILIALAAVIGGVVTLAIGAFIVNGIENMIQSVGKAGDSIMKLISKFGLFKTAEVEGAVVSEETGGGFGPIGIAIGAIIIAVTLLLTHWKEVWSTIKAIASDVADFFKKWWGLILAPFTAGISLLVQLLIDHWQQIWHDIVHIWGDIESFFKAWWPVIVGVFFGPIGVIVGLFYKFHSQIFSLVERLASDVAGWFERMWHDATSWVGRLVNDVVSYIESLPGRFVAGFERIIGDFEQLGENIVNAIIHGIENMGSGVAGAIKGILSHVPGSGLLKHIPGIGSFFAEGGLVTKPTIGVVGEAGPELIVPLNKYGINSGSGGGVQPLSSVLPPGGSSAPGAMTNNFYFQTNADAGTIANETTWALQRLVG